MYVLKNESSKNQASAQFTAISLTVLGNYDVDVAILSNNVEQSL